MKSSLAYQERRKGLPPIPPKYELEKYLDIAQIFTIRQMENYGWSLEIVRRNNRSNALALLRSHGADKWMAIEEDGDIVENPDISIR